MNVTVNLYYLFIELKCNRVYLCSLDLDAWINEPPSESESEDEQPKAIFSKEESKHSRPRHTEVDEKELARVSYFMTVALPNVTIHYNTIH